MTNMLTKLGVKCLHSGLYILAGLSGNLHGNLVVGHSFNESKDHRSTGFTAF